MSSVYPRLRDGVASKQSAYVCYQTQRHELGTLAITGDGRRFRYAKMVSGTQINTHEVAQMCPPVANHVTEAGAVTGFTAVNMSNAAKPMGATLGATADYLNEYENGLFKFQSATVTGGGQAWNVPGHALAGSGGVLRWTTTEPVTIAVSGVTSFSFVHNPWGSIIQSPAVRTAPIAGVVLCDWPAATTAAPNFGWVQTWGLCPVLLDTTNLVAGHGVVPSVATAGCCGVAVQTTIPQRIGAAMEAMATNSVYASVFLQIG